MLSVGRNRSVYIFKAGRRNIKRPTYGNIAALFQDKRIQRETSCKRSVREGTRVTHRASSLAHSVREDKHHCWKSEEEHIEPRILDPPKLAFRWEDKARTQKANHPQTLPERIIPEEQ